VHGAMSEYSRQCTVQSCSYYMYSVHLYNHHVHSCTLRKVLLYTTTCTVLYSIVVDDRPLLNSTWGVQSCCTHQHCHAHLCVQSCCAHLQCPYSTFCVYSPTVHTCCTVQHLCMYSPILYVATLRRPGDRRGRGRVSSSRRSH